MTETSSVPSFYVDRVIENDPRETGTYTHTVVLEFSAAQWRHLLGDIARHITAAYGLGIMAKILAAGDRANTIDREDHLSRFVAMLGMRPPRIALTPEQATTLAADLDICAEEPETCQCGAMVDLREGDRCGVCADRSDFRVIRGGA